MAGWNPTARPEALPKVSGAQGNPAGSPGGTPGGPKAGTDIKGWAGKNRTTLLAAGAGGVVLLALVMKSRAGASADESAAAGTMTTNPQNLAAYDSTSSDVYNALQPQLEQIQSLLNEWGTNKGAESTTPVTTTPTTTPTTTVPVKVNGVAPDNTIRDAFGQIIGNVSQIGAGSGSLVSQGQMTAGNIAAGIASGTITASGVSGNKIKTEADALQHQADTWNAYRDMELQRILAKEAKYNAGGKVALTESEKAIKAAALAAGRG